MKKLLSLMFVVGLVVLVSSQANATPYVGVYSAQITGGFQGLPDPLNIEGRYTFDDTAPPALTYDSTRALYNILSHEVRLNGTVFPVVPYFAAPLDKYGKIDVYNDDPSFPGSTTLRDKYIVGVGISGNLSPDLSVKAVGFVYSQSGTNPTALDSLSPPTSLADLSGFGGGKAYLHFSNSSGNWGDEAPVSLELNAVPEPATMLLLGSGLAGLAAVRRKMRKK